MRRTAFVVATAITSVLSISTAFATPPTGDAKFKDMTRAQAVEGATVSIYDGNDFASGSYTVAPEVSPVGVSCPVPRSSVSTRAS